MATESGRLVRPRRMLASASCLLLAAALLTACTSSGTTAASPPHGVVPAIGPAPTVVLPPGQQAPVRVTAVTNHIDQSNDIMWGDDAQIGPAYDFTIGKEPSSAVVSFTVDPSRLPASVRVPNATPAGLYIQVFEPALGSWIPLRSTYDAKDHAVTAIAPHLSVFSLAWSFVTCMVTCTADLFGKIAERFLANVAGNINDAWSPEQEPDDCAAEADKEWTVRSTIQKLSGCVIDRAGFSAPPVIQVENPLLLPMIIRPPAGAPHAGLTDQPFVSGGHPEFSSLLTGIIAWAVNATVLAPRSYGVIPLQELPQSGEATMATQPDSMAVVMDSVLSILAALPGEKAAEAEAEREVDEVLPDFVTKVALDPGSVTLGDILKAAANKAKQQGPRLLSAFSMLDISTEAYECVSGNAGKDVRGAMEKGGVISGTLDAAFNLAKNCVETSLRWFGKEASESLEAVLNLMDAVPNFAKTVREAIQYVELGPRSMTATTIATSEFVAFAGDWYGHGRNLDISGDGHFTLSARTYQWCSNSPPPCDSMSGNTIVPGDRASGQLTAVSGNVATGHVAQTTDPTETRLGPITLSLDAKGDIITDPSSGTYCGASAEPGACGA